MLRPLCRRAATVPSAIARGASVLVRCTSRAGGALFVFALLLFTACSDSDVSPLTPEVSGLPARSIAGVPGFYFLPPIAKPGAFTGTFDGSLPVTVQICAGVQTPCAASNVIASYSTAAPRAQDRVRVGAEEEAYMTTWLTNGAGLDPAKTYRIHVLVGEVELGHADVDVIRTAAERRTVQSGFVPLVSGEALPIRFRIEQGVIAAKVIGSQGGAVSTSDGGVTLALPAGAVEDGTVITIQSTSNAPNADGRLVEGTIYEFGPHAIQFSRPVTVSIKYDPARVPSGVSARMLRLHTYENGRWVLVKGGAVDPATQTITGQTMHFSTYAALPARFVQVEAGEFHMCGLNEAGTAWCWGANDVKQLGLGEGIGTVETCTGGYNGSTAVPCNKYAQEVAGGLVFTEIAAGAFHTCGLTSSTDGGKIYCWGRNNNGQLGDGSFTDRAAPVLIGSGYTEVTAGWMHTCARTGNSVDCWGRNSWGQLGASSVESCLWGTSSVPCSSTPSRITSGLPPVVEVAAGFGHTCARTSGGEAYCWGWNVFGQLGNGTRSTSMAPVRVGGGSYASLAPGALHSCATGTGTNGSAAYCWGDNSYTGALGNGSIGTVETSPVQVNGSSWKVLAASEGNNYLTHSCGVKSDGTVECWGANNEGQLGQATTAACNFAGRFSFNCSSTPLAVSGGLAFGGVVTGLQTTCGFTTAGDLYCWGWNSVGQLGNGTTVSKLTPTKVATAAPVASSASASRIGHPTLSFSVSPSAATRGSLMVPIIP